MRIADGFTGQRFLAVPFQVTEQMATGPLTKLLHVCAIGHFPKAGFHYVRRMQGCQEFIFIYCTEGSGTVEIGNTRHRLGANQYIVIPRGASHEYYTSQNQPWTIYWMHLRGTLAEHMLQGMDKPQDVSPCDDSRIDERNHLFDEIYNVLETHEDIAAQEYATALLLNYVATLRHIDVYRSPVSGRHAVTHTDTVVRKTIHYMNEHIENRLTIDDLARFCGYSPSYFYRKFVKEAGLAPIDYFNRLKINRACFWLIHSNMTISQIASRLAFSESQYFARTFKKQMGISATDYRKQNT